jgi:hypothetical protein
MNATTETGRNAVAGRRQICKVVRVLGREVERFGLIQALMCGGVLPVL